MLRKGVNKFQGYGWRGGSRGGVYHLLSSSCLALEIRFGATRAAVRGRGTKSALRAWRPWRPRGPNNGVPILRPARARDSVTYSRSVCGPRSETAKSLVAARYAVRVRTNVYGSSNGVLPIAKIRASLVHHWPRIHVSPKIHSARAGWLASDQLIEADQMRRCCLPNDVYLCYISYRYMLLEGKGEDLYYWNYSISLIAYYYALYCIYRN